MKNPKKEIQQQFNKFIYEITYKNLWLTSGFILLVVTWFAWSDINIRNNMQAFYTRLLTLFLVLGLMVFQLITGEKYKPLKHKLYNLLIASALIMMYAKYLVYLPYEGSAYSVSGIILVIFLISLDLKTASLNAALIYFVPTLALLIIVFFFAQLPESKVVNFSNLFPMLILGFVANRIQFRLRFKLFESNYFLELEKQTTSQLYDESLEMNHQLHQQNEEIEVQKQAIEEKNLTLEKLNEAKDKFLSIVSHDLKTPFTALVGYSRLLHTDFDALDTAKKKEYIAIIHSNINQTHRLLDNLLLWAETQIHQYNLHLKPENIYNIAADTMGFLQHTAKLKQIDLLNLVDKNLLAHADRNLIETVLRNLVSNAIKFSHKNGLIEVKARELPVINDKHLVQITVSDSGVGMSPEKQAKLFSIKEKVSTKGTENEAGTGLGLLICKELVERHGGEISVESSENKGSSFSFTFRTDNPQDEN
jgi:signal transduction histidine kinase